MKKMFITFCHSMGFGNCIKEIDYEIESADDIRELEKSILQENQLSNVAILSINSLPIK